MNDCPCKRYFFLTDEKNFVNDSLKKNKRVNFAFTNNFCHPSVHDLSYSHKLFVAVNK